ncbi:MAG: hypothetical protein ACFFAO_15315 [Candidatus Hermodarchaeota archaeon]
MATIIDAIFTVLIINTVLLAIGTIIFGIASTREKELFLYYPIYIFFLIGNFFILNQFVDNIYKIIGTIFFIATAFSVFMAAFLDYYKIVIKSDLTKSHISYSILLALVISSLVEIMQICMIFIFTTASIMLFRVYLKTKSIVKLLFMVCALTAVISQISQLNPYFDVEYGLFFAYAVGTVYITILLINGIVAILEQEIMNTIKIKNTLKDNYSHDLGNILHSLSMSYELLKDDTISEHESDELYSLLTNKIDDASKLIKEIRKL